MIQSARSMWAARSAGVALSSRRREMRMSRCGKVKIFCCQSLKASMSGKTKIFLPLRELRRSDVSPDLPPVASHRYWGIMAEQMMAVFSDSTRATVLSECWGRRCSPKRHWVSSDTDRNCLGRSLRGMHSSLALRFSLRYPSLKAWSRIVLKQRK